MSTALFSNVNRVFGDKIHNTHIWGNRLFALFPGRFSKDIWEAKLFGVAENIVWRCSGRLNLNFECKRLYFSNLKSPLAPKIRNALAANNGSLDPTLLRGFDLDRPIWKRDLCVWHSHWIKGGMRMKRKSCECKAEQALETCQEFSPVHQTHNSWRDELPPGWEQRDTINNMLNLTNKNEKTKSKIHIYIMPAHSVIRHSFWTIARPDSTRMILTGPRSSH